MFPGSPESAYLIVSFVWEFGGILTATRILRTGKYACQQGQAGNLPNGKQWRGRFDEIGALDSIVEIGQTTYFPGS
jgi:hypothetical protein